MARSGRWRHRGCSRRPGEVDLMAAESHPTKGHEFREAAPVGPAARRRGRRWLLFLVILSLAAWFAHFAYLRITLKPTPRPDYWEERIAAIDPPGEGAISAVEAYRVLMNRPWENDPEIRALDNPSNFRSALWDTLNAPWDETRDDVGLVNGVLASTEFHQARGRVLLALRAGWVEDISAEPDWYPPRPTEHRIWQLWLLLHSRWQRQLTGEMAGTVEDWLGALRLAREWGRCRMFLMSLSAWGHQEFVAREMLRAAGEQHGPLDCLSLAREIDRLIPPEATLSELLEGERLWMHSSLEHVYVRTGGDWLVISEATGFRSSLAKGPSSRIWNLASPVFHDLATARWRVDKYYSSFSQYNSLACWAPPRAVQYDAETRHLEPGPLEGFSGYAIDRLSEFRLGSYYRMRGAMEAALARLALAEYHRRQGCYPDSLVQLVPAFLPRVPIDCGDGGPLRYHRSGEDYILYSVGQDALDDGGVGELDQRIYFNSQPDVVFSQARYPERLP